MLMRRIRNYTFGDDDEDDEDRWNEDEQERNKEKHRAARKETAAGEDSTSAGTGEDRGPQSRHPVERSAPEPGEILTSLRDADLLPCVYFLPCRKSVEEAAMSASLHRFTTSEERGFTTEYGDVW